MFCKHKTWFDPKLHKGGWNMGKAGYRYQAKTCEWVIIPHEDLWQLRMVRKDGSGQTAGCFANPGQAADNVSAQTTGIYEWDSLPGSQIPIKIGDIGRWSVSRL
jgi:hypothetical protein